MADTYHAIKLYKTTANSTTSSKRVGINVTDSTVTTGYALYVNGAINVTDSLNTNSLNTGDLVVTGSSSFTNGVTVGGELKFNKISAPTASGGTTYGNGTSGQVLKSNGTTVYWASDSNSDTKVTQAAAITNDGAYPIILGYNTATTAVTNTVNKTSTLTYNPSTKALKTGLATTANAIAIYSDANGTLSTKATASGAAYATSANGALTFGTLPVAQGGTGRTALTGSNSLRNDLGFGTGTGALPVANGGTGVTTVDLLALARITDLIGATTEYYETQSITSTSTSETAKVYTVVGSGIVIASATTVTGMDNDYGSTGARILKNDVLYAYNTNRVDVATPYQLGANCVAVMKVVNGDKISLGGFSTKVGTKNLYRVLLAIGCTLTTS
jgi:hypothetical protein